MLYRATVERVETLPQESAAITASAQRIERVLEGSGFIYGIMLRASATAAANTAAVNFAEDAPFTALDTVVYRDVNGESVNLDGYSLFIANLAQANYRTRFLDASAELFTTVPGSGAGPRSARSRSSLSA